MRRKNKAQIPKNIPAPLKEPKKQPWTILAQDFSYSYGEWNQEPVIEFKDPFGQLTFMCRIPLQSLEEFLERGKTHVEWMKENFPDNPIEDALEEMELVTDDTDTTKEKVEHE